MATKIYNRETLTNPNISDDMLLQSCVYMPVESYALADKILKLLNITNHSMVYNNATDYLSKSFKKNPTEAKAIFEKNITSFILKPKKQKTVLLSKKCWRILVEFQKEFCSINIGNVSKGMIIDIALNLYYEYLCSDEYINDLISKRNTILKGG